MNDRSVSVLENYDFEVIRTQKSRNAILCETNKGWFILKEYRGPMFRLEQLDRLLTATAENGFGKTEQLIRTKDGALFCKDQDQSSCIIKTWPGGRECSLKDGQECRMAMTMLARLHHAMCVPELVTESGVHAVSLLEEYEKRNRELKRVRKFLRDKGQKTAFEIYLQQNYDVFFEEAMRVTEEVNAYGSVLGANSCETEGTFCHGDFQHHNLLWTGSMSVINFEKFSLESQMRDLYLFLRKLLEKANWSVPQARGLLDVYGKEKKLTAEDTLQLYYRFAYPEKFWKIVNFYYNSGKAWIPGRNMEKLEKLLGQRSAKKAFLEQTFSL
ncbi:MAG: phosphotransferase [Lachnospiraceae bacterium]|nr:phosphotransferase [Lachnospiraceae bacterium]